MYYIFNVKSRKCTSYSDSKLNSDILKEQGEVQVKSDTAYSSDEILRLELQDGKIELCDTSTVPATSDVEPIDPSLLAIAEALAAQETRLAKLEGGVSK